MSVIHVESNDQFKELVSKGLVVAKFSATWCGPCKQIAPFYEEVASKETGVTFLHVDVDELASLPECQQIRGVPTFKFYKEGSMVSEFAGGSKQKITDNVANLQK